MKSRNIERVVCEMKLRMIQKMKKLVLNGTNPEYCEGVLDAMDVLYSTSPGDLARYCLDVVADYSSDDAMESEN